MAMISFSRKVIIQKSNKNIAGCSKVYLQVIINKRKKVFPVGIHWPVDKFDVSQGLCKIRHKGDEECHENNILITDMLAKANEIFRHFRISQQPLSIQAFVNEWENNFSRKCFVGCSGYAMREWSGLVLSVAKACDLVVNKGSFPHLSQKPTPHRWGRL